MPLARSQQLKRRTGCGGRRARGLLAGGARGRQSAGARLQGALRAERARRRVCSALPAVQVGGTRPREARLVRALRSASLAVAAKQRGLLRPAWGEGLVGSDWARPTACKRVAIHIEIAKPTQGPTWGTATKFFFINFLFRRFFPRSATRATGLSLHARLHAGPPEFGPGLGVYSLDRLCGKRPVLPDGGTLPRLAHAVKKSETASSRVTDESVRVPPRVPYRSHTSINSLWPH